MVYNEKAKKACDHSIRLMRRVEVMDMKKNKP